MDLKRGAKAVQDLESNASKLSKLIPELSEVSKTLEALKKTEVTGQKQLKEYEKNLSKIESQLTESIQLKLAEGLAEVSSRTKDLYDLSITERSKTQSDLDGLKSNLSDQAKALEALTSQLEIISQTVNEMSEGKKKFQSKLLKGLLFIIILLAGAVVLGVM
tara:strand:+ start:111 stop:596 length:486 start_codon:yes stop_codon:yes gene_type:complete